MLGWMQKQHGEKFPPFGSARRALRPDTMLAMQTRRAPEATQMKMLQEDELQQYSLLVTLPLKLAEKLAIEIDLEEHVAPVLSFSRG